jgi:hypothetical protein
MHSGYGWDRSDGHRGGSRTAAARLEGDRSVILPPISLTSPENPSPHGGTDGSPIAGVRT